ncbi:unnamed protein product [Prunus armeniaca]
MVSIEVADQKPHALCIPFPYQGHINPLLKFAKLLHHRGFRITFAYTKYNHKNFLKSLGHDTLDGLTDFHFETISNGVPPSDLDSTQDIYAMCDSINHNFLAPFRALLAKLNDAATSNNTPPVTSIVSDGFMSFSITAAEELGLLIVLFFPTASCGFMGFKHYRALVEKGFTPLKDESCLTNGFLDKVIDWIPGMKGIRLRDLPTNFRTTDPNDILFNFALESIERVHKASAVVLHTFDALEPDVLNALSSMLPLVYAIGPDQLLLNQLPEDPLKHIGYSLWKEETECLEWLKSKAPNSVVYVNFGSIAVLTPQQLVEFGWGLANSKLPFFWVIRPDLVVGESAILPPEFVAETKERGLIASWCPQEQVLNDPSVGGFLTHGGWNSTIESLCAGVPMLCWPFFADQQTNCYYACNEWGIGLEINNDVKRDQVEKLVKELMGGEKGKKMKNKVMEWKKLAEEATCPHGSSSTNLDNLVNQEPTAAAAPFEVRWLAPPPPSIPSPLLSSPHSLPYSFPSSSPFLSSFLLPIFLPSPPSLIPVPSASHPPFLLVPPFLLLLPFLAVLGWDCVTGSFDPELSIFELLWYHFAAPVGCFADLLSTLIAAFDFAPGFFTAFPLAMCGYEGRYNVDAGVFLPI